MLTLSAETRDTKNDPKELRADGKLPAVFYGPKEESVAIAISARDFEKIFKEAGESTLVKLTGDFGEKETLIYDVDVDPVSYKPRHADFYVPEKGKKVIVSIPIEFEGISPAVKELGGTLVKVLYEVEVEAEPAKLPHELVVDISVLKDFDTQITAGDIKLPEGVTLAADADEIVANVSEAREEEPEEEPEAVDLSQIEVEQKGKKEDEAEGAEGSQESGE